MKLLFFFFIMINHIECFKCYLKLKNYKTNYLYIKKRQNQYIKQNKNQYIKQNKNQYTKQKK